MTPDKRLINFERPSDWAGPDTTALMKNMKAGRGNPAPAPAPAPAPETQSLAQQAAHIAHSAGVRALAPVILRLFQTEKALGKAIDLINALQARVEALERQNLPHGMERRSR